MLIIIPIIGLAAAATSLFGCIVLWAWLTTLPARRLLVLSALVVLGVGGLWLGAG